jgi:hypothetical protein
MRRPPRCRRLASEFVDGRDDPEMNAIDPSRVEGLDFVAIPDDGGRRRRVGPAPTAGPHRSSDCGERLAPEEDTVEVERRVSDRLYGPGDRRRDTRPPKDKHRSSRGTRVMNLTPGRTNGRPGRLPGYSQSNGGYFVSASPSRPPSAPGSAASDDDGEHPFREFPSEEDREEREEGDDRAEVIEQCGDDRKG